MRYESIGFGLEFTSTCQLAALETKSCVSAPGLSFVTAGSCGDVTGLTVHLGVGTTVKPLAVAVVNEVALCESDREERSEHDESVHDASVV